jgi:hypothetical protein
MGKTVKNEKVYIRNRTAGITAESDRKDGEGVPFVPGCFDYTFKSPQHKPTRAHPNG